MQNEEATTFFCFPTLVQTSQSVTLLTSDADWAVINLSMKKLVLSLENPPVGTLNSFRHIGHGMDSPLSLPYCSMHVKQNV